MSRLLKLPLNGGSMLLYAIVDSHFVNNLIDLFAPREDVNYSLDA